MLPAFYIFDIAHQNMISQIQTTPETTPYTFEINILGLRDLKPFSMLPIKKAYINFEMTSLNISGNEKVILLFLPYIWDFLKVQFFSYH